MKKSPLILAAILAVGAPFSLSAADVYWDIDGATLGAGGATPAGTWGVDPFWSVDPTGGLATGAWIPGDTAIFSAGADAIGAYTVTVSGTQTAGGLRLEEGTVSLLGGTVAVGSGPIVVNAGAILTTDSSLRVTTAAGSTVTLNGGTLRTTNAGAAGTFFDADSQIILGAAGGTFSYTTPNVLNIVQTGTKITGTGSLTKTGAGVLAVASAAGNNTYSGGTIVNEGELRIRTVANTLPITTAVTVNSPGIFNLNGVSQQIGSLTGGGSVGLANGTLTVGDTTNTVFTGTIKDTANAGASGSASVGGNVVKVGTGTLTLTGLNGHTGTTTLNAGNLTVDPGASLAAATANLAVNGGVLNLNNGAQTIKNLSGTGGTINLSSGYVLTSDPAASSTYAGTIAGSGGLTRLNVLSGATNRTLTLTGPNTYDGNTLVNGGNVSVGSATALGSTVGYTEVASGAEIIFTGVGVNFTTNEPFRIAGNGNSDSGAIAIIASSTPTLSGPVTLTGDATVTVSSSATGTFNHPNAFTSLANQNLTLQGGSGAGGGGTISGVIALGTGGLTKLQGGRWTLTAANTYSGTTTIGAGTLQLGNGLAGNDGTISNSLSIVNNATLAFNRFGIEGYSGAISGTGAVVKTGAGTQILSGANSYTGATVLGGGVLSVATIGNGGVLSGNMGSASSAATNLIFDGGTLQYTGATDSTDRNFTINTGKIAIFDIAGNEIILNGASTATDGALTKVGTGILTLGGANAYTGLTEIDLGTIRLAASERIADASNLLLNGGTFDSAGFSETLGTLDQDAPSILDFGAGSSALTFADSDSLTWSGILTVTNWTAGLDTFRVGIDGTGFDAQLAQIQFADFGNAPGQIDSNGFITPLVVPEPSSALLSLFGGLGLLARLRRHG